MLEVSLAKNLIEHLSEYTNYNINIMNEDGIIIASRDSNRIGSFHEVAYKLIRGSSDIEYTDNDEKFVGVLSGVNMVLNVDGKPVGVLGITGNPEEVKPVALVVKMAVETLIKYESLKMQAFRRQTSKERFLYMLSDQEDADYSEIKRLASELNYAETYIRIPIICTFNTQTQRDTALTKLKLSPLHSSEDISSILEDKSIIIFKTLDKDNAIQAYREKVEDYINSAFENSNFSYKCYAGTMQSSFIHYHNAVKHTKWLEKNIVSNSDIVYFYDYMSQYIIDTLPHDEMDSIFKIFDESFDKNFKKNFVEIISALIAADFNLVKAAKNSLIHRNTFLYRYNKIKEVLENDEQSNAKCLMIWLSVYFSI